MQENTRFELNHIPVRYEGSAHDLQSYTILIPGRETSFSLPVDASEQDIVDRAASALAQYRTDPAVPLQLLWHYTAQRIASCAFRIWRDTMRASGHTLKDSITVSRISTSPAP